MGAVKSKIDAGKSQMSMVENELKRSIGKENKIKTINSEVKRWII